ncbi:dTDP-glucose 4,6-dehydratase [Desulfobacterales bacterium HSG16]|nr:dTDP-glucose 4,6-dehydratase [Desulfobacterales bacterium HSG16]
MDYLMITGGCGFIGSNLIRHLFLNSDFKGSIINVDNLSYAGNPENLEDIKTEFSNRYIFVQADICDMDALADIFDKYPVDAICHLAAQSHVDRSIEKPDDFIQTNINGTYNLLELARKYMIRFHHVSTDEVYGSLGPKGLFTETSLYMPSSPYSASKAASDHLVRAWGVTYNLPVTISNCSNNYGPYQFPEKLMPLMVLNALGKKALPVYGDGLNIRDWLYVEDHCRAIVKILQDGILGETYNVGGNCEMANIDVVNMICDILDKMAPTIEKQPHRELITFIKDRPGHDRRYAIDSTKITQKLGWKPEENFASGIEKTIKWYLDNQKWVERVQTGEYRAWMERQYKK